MKVLKWIAIIIGGLTILIFGIAAVQVFTDPIAMEKIRQEGEANKAARAKQEAIDKESENKAVIAEKANKAAGVQKQQIAAQQKISAPIKSYYNATMAALKPCEVAANGAIGDVVEVAKGRKSAYVVYPIVSNAETACSNAKAELASLPKPDDLPEKIEKSIEDGSLNCFMAANVRYESLGLMMKMLDGDFRPSMLNEMQKMAEQVQGATMMCGANLASAAMQAGIKADDLK
jgi:hypothetical protein